MTPSQQFPDLRLRNPRAEQIRGTKCKAQLALIMRGVLQAGCLRRRRVSRAAFGGSGGRQGGTTEGSCPGIWSRCPDGGAERSLTAHADCSRFECAIPPRTRSPAVRSRLSWPTPVSAAQGGYPVQPSVTGRASPSRRGCRTVSRCSAVTAGKTALMAVPDRSTGNGDRNLLLRQSAF